MENYMEFLTKVYEGDDITLSPSDQRRYRCLNLTNGMGIFLISDPDTDRSAAAMDIHIGNMSDPSDLPGLAHFCEHMLFLGTEKFPNENEYGKFLNEHGGGSNASTSTEHTSYHFNVGPDHLQGALDRFAQFFLCPLFTESATEREVNAVNSENDKNVKVDSRRVYQLSRMLSDPQHPYARFGTGNRATLESNPREKGIDVRSELLKFHSQHYSSNIMQLCVLGRESLEELSEMTVKLFSGVENKNVTIPEWPQHPYQAEQLQRKVCVVPVKDIRFLKITWPIPDMSQYYHSKPISYLSHVIGHEGPGSLLSQLKRQGWSNSLIAGSGGGSRGFNFFYVKVDLTEDGLENTEEIVRLAYQFIHMIQKEGPQRWIWDECKELKSIKFRFKDKEDPVGYVTSLVRDNHLYSVQDALSGPYLWTDFRPDLIDLIVNKLNPRNMSAMVVAKKFSGETDKQERWYGTNYKVEPYSESLLQEWESCGLHENFYLHAKNEFIPENLELVTREEETAYPQLIKNDSLTRLWYKQDNKFLLPKAFITLQLESPYAYTDPGHVCMLTLFESLLDDVLTEYTYAAKLAGLLYSFVSCRQGITISVKGYSDKQKLLLEKIVEKMTQFKVDSSRFNIHKENLERSLRNYEAEQPNKHATFDLSQITSDILWTKEERLHYLQDITAEKLQDFIHLFLSRLHIEGLIYGNITKQGALDTVGVVEDMLRLNGGTRPQLSSQCRMFRAMQLPTDSYHLYQKTNSIHKSSCVCTYYQCGSEDTRSNVLLELLKQVVGEPAFDTLRTKEQLGYIVWTRVRRLYGVQGFVVLVQSDKSTPYVESRIEAFLQEMESKIKGMSEADFAKHVEALTTRRLEKPKKMSIQNAIFLGEIEDKVYHFDRDNIEIPHLQTLTKEDLYGFFKDYISHDAPHRKKLAVHVISTVDRVAMEKSHTNGYITSIKDHSMGDAQVQSDARAIGIIENQSDMSSPASKDQPKVITSIPDFKTTLAVYPRLKPVIDVSITPDSKL